MDDRTKPDSFAEAAWSDLWHQEIAAIKRSRRTTYLLVGLIAAIACLIVLLPNLVA
ncbi:MAG TPA: hypothetical protein VF816_01220 [Rhodocyclaceae bacterium]